MALTPQFIIFAMAEPYPSPPGGGKAWRRTFYAVRVGNGTVAAHWQAQLPHWSFSADRDRFLQLVDQLFYVTAEAVAKINLEDIAAKQHGWQ